jgi:hypothetical protein
VLALLVWGQTALPGGVERVCRYTGRRAAPCAACPDEKARDEHARLLAQDCCELRQGHAADMPVVPPSLDAPPPVYWVALPAQADWHVPVPRSRLGPRIRAGQDPPPRASLFLSLRQWLI